MPTPQRQIWLKMRQYTGVFLVLTGILCSGRISAQEARTSPVGDAQVYEFLNWFISLHAIYNCRTAEPALKWNEQELRPIPDLPDGSFSATNPFIFRGIEKMLGEDVIRHMYIQYRANKSRKWDAGQMPKARMLEEESVRNLLAAKDKKTWTLFRRDMGNFLILYSVPLFSPDYEYVMVKFEKVSGPDASEGCTFLYRKIPGKSWELYDTIKCFSRKP
jgi:hypothetical protein